MTATAAAKEDDVVGAYFPTEKVVMEKQRYMDSLLEGATVQPERESTLYEMTIEVEKLAYAIASELGLNLPAEPREKADQQLCNQVRVVTQVAMTTRATLMEVMREVQRTKSVLGGL